MKIIRVLALLFVTCLAGVPFADAQKKLTASELAGARRQASVEPRPAAEGAPSPQQSPAPKTKVPERISTPVDETEVDAVGTSTDTVAATPAVSGDMPAARFSLVIASAVVAGVLMILAALGFVLWIRTLNNSVGTLMLHVHEIHQLQRDRDARDKVTTEELAKLRKEIGTYAESLGTAILRIPADAARLIQPALPDRESRDQTHRQPARTNATSSVYDTYDEPRGAEDGVAQLLTIANRIVQQSATTLDAFRASTGALGVNVSPWPNADGQPAAFIVEHRGSYYAVPNVVKPTRLPQEWFNRTEFGVNDEIQRVESLPRLRPRGGGYEVQDPGVFGR